MNHRADLSLGEISEARGKLGDFFYLSGFSSGAAIECTRDKSMMFVWSGRTLLFQKLWTQTSDDTGQWEGREGFNCSPPQKVLSVLDWAQLALPWPVQWAWVGLGLCVGSYSSDMGVGLEFGGLCMCEIHQQECLNVIQSIRACFRNVFGLMEGLLRVMSAAKSASLF